MLIRSYERTLNVDSRSSADAAIKPEFISVWRIKAIYEWVRFVPPPSTVIPLGAYDWISRLQYSSTVPLASYPKSFSHSYGYCSHISIQVLYGDCIRIEVDSIRNLPQAAVRHYFFKSFSLDCYHTYPCSTLENTFLRSHFLSPSLQTNLPVNEA